MSLWNVSRANPRTRLRAEYRIQDFGPFVNWVLFETFALDTYAAKFYEMLLALGIDEQVTNLELDQLTGMKLAGHCQA